jgi:membrane-bound serine protease (ClpP class)
VAAGGLGCLGLFFWGHHLAGLAGWEDLALVVVGVILIVLEAFVIPGFGVAGILGGLSLAGGLVLAMTRRDIGDEGFGAEAVDVLMTVLATLAATVVVIVLFIIALPRLVPSVARPSRGAQRLTLSATVARGGKGPSPPGFLTRMLGGAETVGRDIGGHTAISHEPDDDPARPRDPAIIDP